MMALLFKVILKRYQPSVPEITFQVNAALTGIQYFYAKVTCKTDIYDVPKDMQWPMFTRCLNGFLCDVFMYIAFGFTDYSKAWCMFMTNTLFSPFMARYILGEQIKLADIVGILIGFIGMVLLANPFGQKEDAGVEEGSKLWADVIGLALGFCSAITAALAIVYARMVSDKVHHAIPAMVYPWLSCILSGVWSLFAPQRTL
jgi:drug/metabolite transporter (DMT)-like permease